MTKWIAEGATVLEEGGEADNIICGTFGPKPGDWFDQEDEAAAHRMARQIADEHNRLMEVTRIATESTWMGNDAYDILTDILRVLQEAKP